VPLICFVSDDSSQLNLGSPTVNVGGLIGGVEPGALDVGDSASNVEGVNIAATRVRLSSQTKVSSNIFKLDDTTVLDTETY